MGFGKLLKDVAGGIRDIREEGRERKRLEQVREYQRKEDIGAGRFCKGCGKTGQFDNKCNDCSRFPFCNDCCLNNEKWGTMCMNCAPKYMCDSKGCICLSDDECVVCNKKVCQKNHWYPFFMEKNQFFSCVFDKGNVCRYCVEKGKKGMFTKHYNCLKCGYELQQKIIN